MSRSVDAGPVADLPEGAMRRIDVDGRMLGVCRHEGTLRAFDARCPHMHADLTEGILDGGGVDCPHHLWRFDLVSGQCLMVPGFEIEIFAVREQDGRVLVELP